MCEGIFLHLFAVQFHKDCSSIIEMQAGFSKMNISYQLLLHTGDSGTVQVVIEKLLLDQFA